MGTLSAFGKAYIDAQADATSLLPHDFRDPSARAKSVEVALAQRAHPALLSSLRANHARWGCSPTQERHLRALEEGSAAVVVTGQQVGLLLGPLYTVYKAASAVATAQALSQETGKTVIPLFWLQTEDHDLEEIASAHIPPTSLMGHPLQVSLGAENERCSVWHVPLPQKIAPIMQAVRSHLEGLPHADELAPWYEAYSPGQGIGEAFAKRLCGLFADQGLLLLQPREPALAALAQPLHRRVLQEHEALSGLLTSRAEALKAKGFQVQIEPRPECSLSFYHPEGPEGPRFRLIPEGAHVQLAGHPFQASTDALLEALEEEPLRASTSALLRPLLQDTLLPTAAYVGGPGEISYFAQMPPLYQWLGRPMPLIIPRARFVAVEGFIQEQLSALALSPDALKQPDEELLARWLEDAPGPSEQVLQERVLDPLKSALASLQDEIEALDPNLLKALNKTGDSLAHNLGKFASKVRRARLYHDPQRVQKLSALRQHLMPKQAPQERLYTLPYFIAKYGQQAFIEKVLAALVPYDAAQKELQL